MDDPNEDTEWNDILRQHGVLPERPKSPTEELERAMEEAVERAHANRLEGRSLKELDELDEDGLEDEDFIQQYREKRIREIQQQASRERFGEVVKITKTEYTQEVTEASEQFFVVVHIANASSMQSRLLEVLLQKEAYRFKDVKFVEIQSTQINERFPSSQTPTILFYHNKQLAYQLVTLTTIGGTNTTLADIDKLLVTAKVTTTADPRLLMNKDEESEDEY